MKETPLTPVHRALGAKMAPFAGYEMPISYTGIKAEHLTVRQAAGMFDVSHMGEFIIRGKGAPAFVQKLVTNDIEKTYPGRVQYNCMTNEQGGIIDDLLVYRIEDEVFMAVVNAANKSRDWEWMNRHAGPDVELIDISDDTILLAIQGPRATQVLQPLTGVELDELKYYTFTKDKLAGADNVLISATGYTGAGGFELYFDRKDARTVWDAIMKQGGEHGLKPVGLGARDTLRLEMGFGLHGNDMDETITPLEARLGWLTKLDTDFIGSKALRKLKEEGLHRKLAAFELLEKGIPRKDYPIFDREGKEVGVVTSGTMSPSLNKPIGMGYVPPELAKSGNDLQIGIRKKRLAAKTVKLPFYKASKLK